MSWASPRSTTPGHSCCSARRGRVYERRSSHRPFRELGRFLPTQTTAVSIVDRLLHHATVVITDGESFRMKDAQHREESPQTVEESPRGGGVSVTPDRHPTLARLAILAVPKSMCALRPAN